MSEAVTLTHLNFAYTGDAVLKDVSAGFRQGKLHALFGPNGCGKSTLLKCVVGLLPVQGVEVFGRQLHTLTPRQRAKLVGYVPQEHRTGFPFTTQEVVLMGRTPHLGGLSGPRAADRQAAMDAMTEVGVQELAQRPYTQLSGGQRQLVLIARALCQDAPLLVLDEPTSALDFKNQLLVWNTLCRLRDGGRTILVCTHDPNHLLWYCDEALCLQDGRVLAQGPAQQLVQGPLLEQLYGPVCMLQNGTVRPKPFEKSC